MAQTLENRVHLFRLQILIIDGGLLVLRNVIDQALTAQGIHLSVCLNQERSTVARLKSRGVITQEQYDILFPTGGHVPTTSEMDLTLIICLLRCLGCFGLNKTFDWKATPESDDVSIEADICRLKAYRNEISHKVQTTDIQANDFVTFWNDIEQILVRLSSPALKIRQIIADFKTCPLDPEEEKRVQEEIKKWKDYEADVDRLKEEMTHVKVKVTEVEKTQEEIKRRLDEDTNNEGASSLLKEEEQYQKHKKCLRQYLESFYSKSASFYNFRSDLAASQNVLLRIGPLFRKLDITHKEDIVMNQNEAMIKSMQMPKYIHNDIRRSKPILLLAEYTTPLANFIVSYWLNYGENHTFFPMNLKILDGVFLVKIEYFDDVSDLDKMLEDRFQMKEFYYTQNILIIFEFFGRNHFKLKKVCDLACSRKLKTCSFIFITNIERKVVDDLKLDIEVILIADTINALHVYSNNLNVEIDGYKLSRRIDQIVSERKRGAIKKICFENIHPINKTAKICVPDDIKDIRLHRCSHKFQVMHCAEHLDISEPQRFTNPLTENIYTPKLTTLAIHFESPSHIFYNNIYEHFACNISKANHIKFLRLCNMSFGKKVINVQLQKEEIEQIRRSVESKEDNCRFGARILGPRLGKISFDKEDIEIERSNSFLKQIMLDLICYELAKTHNSVSECYPSEMNDGAITLICFVNDEFQIDTFNGFRLLKRYNNCISKESLLAENACDIEDDTIVKAIEEEFKDINETLSFHAEALMASHRNLEAVKVSFVQPKDIRPVPSNLSIVLYCKAKGYIPFGDVCFPRTLNHPLKNKLFRTDVREGSVSTCHFRPGHSTDFNKTLALGSSIGEVGGNIAGTLGPFVNIKETNTICFLTARHVFGPISRTNVNGVNVVQPADVHLIPGAVGLPNRNCGMVIESQGGGKIDASLVQISPERLPTSGQFIQLTKEDIDLAGLATQPKYNDGKCLDAKTLTVKDLATRRIIKIGCTTSLTKGTLSTTDGCVRETVENSTLETLYNGSKESFQVNNQIMVDSYYKKVFTQAGDSGSGVFLVDDKDSLHCIGMLIGVCSDMTAVVTPINNILQILGQKMGKTLELTKFRETEEMDES